MRQQDVKEQINHMYDQRDEKHHWIEDYRESKFNASLKNWFRGFTVRKRSDSVQIVGLFFNVSGEELYRKWDNIITDIDRRLYPVEITGASTRERRPGRNQSWPPPTAGKPGMMSRQRCPQTTISRATVCAMRDQCGRKLPAVQASANSRQRQG